jgi:hypothetical protein
LQGLLRGDGGQQSQEHLLKVAPRVYHAYDYGDIRSCGRVAAPFPAL